MFNSPILDITIGLVFIFLLYSLLATSINEAIATGFSLRARMLRTAIMDHLLSNIPKDSRWKSFWKGIQEMIMSIPRIFIGRKREIGKIGEAFFDHPIIRNYGSSRIFDVPSYLSSRDFSFVLIDILKKDFDNKVGPNAAAAKMKFSGEIAKDPFRPRLVQNQDVDKIRQVLDFYKEAHEESATRAMMQTDNKSHDEKSNWFLDHEVLEVLDLLLKKSKDELGFQKELEIWYDAMMDRVSGWYKRRTQFILFIMGLVMAIIFNLDSIGIANKLSTNTDARKILVAQAMAYAEQHQNQSASSNNSKSPQDDPKSKPSSTAIVVPKKDTANTDYKKDSTIQALRDQLKGISDFKKKEIDTINTLLALGWGDYGIAQCTDTLFRKYFTKESHQKSATPGLPAISNTPTAAEKSKWLNAYYKEHSWPKFKFVLWQTFTWRKFLGFLIFAFAISLGAPFWFDMLNKVIKLRGAGTKENGDEKVSSVRTIPGNATPIVITSQVTEEAQG